MADRQPRPALRVALLGPLTAEVDGRSVEVPGHLRRSLLALLALAAPRVVSASSLIDALWPDDPPETGTQALHTQVSRLRRTLGPAATRVQRCPPGYRLDLDPADLDVVTARHLAREVTAELTRRPARAADLATQALQLWRGPGLEEFSTVEPLAAEAVTVADLHRHLQHQAVAARLELGDPTVAREAAALAAADPLHEPSVVLWVRALAAEGRPAEALQVAAAFRRRLVDETGLDPSPQLAELEQRVASGAPGTTVTPPIRRTVPRPVGPLEGREQDRALLDRLLGTEAAVTVTGPGGVGKTRLVLDVVADLTERGGCDAVVVALAAVTDPRRVPEALASTLGLRTEGPPSIAGVADGLAAQQLLLVLDNCEHVASVCRDLVVTLQARAPLVRVLATSRVSLHVPGEHVLRLQPLPVPGADLPLERLRRQPSVRAFLEYATRRNARFTVDESDVDDLVEVIRRLDGLPLGLELAAGQIAVMPLRSVRRRLDRALDVLTTERTDDDARQQTLRATVDWSYRLLTDPERSMLATISMFPGGVDLETVEDLTRVGDDRGGDPVLVLGRLVDASLVVHDDHGRYGLLETIRQFVLDRLQVEEGRDRAESLFLDWAVRTAHELSRDLLGPDEAEADARLRTELANLRVARDLARSRGDLDRLVRITLAVDEPSTWRNLSELWAWAAELADEPGLAGHPQQARMLAAAANASWLQGGDLEAAEQLARRGLQISGPEGPAASRCWSALATVALFRGAFDEALDGFERAAQVDPHPAGSLVVAALLAVYARRSERVQLLLDRARRLLRDRPVPSQLSFALYVEGEAAAALGDSATAIVAYTSAIESAERAGVGFVAGIAGVGLASTLARSGQVTAAVHQFQQLLRYWTTTGNSTQLWTTLRNVGWLLADQGRLPEAATLLAAADAAPAAAALDAESRVRVADVLRAAPDRTQALGPAEAVRSAESALATLG